ncbi:hypothetical protein JQ604_30865 [Bradyrhizobium jicamae]|uniref:XkdW family protein n=1 Tax=Bradyrhizobium jicamae TaxID=280332 RepID=UPI001BADD17E|nr:hypothetical protein [Bradyrhizobium jicamae]MBR0756601.1 hypothetical protein [Bradyrhizobium jicamae]
MAYNPSQILSAVLSLRPGLEVHADFELADRNDGRGPFIAVWNRADVAQPSQAEIEAVDTQTLAGAEQTVSSQDLMAQFTPDDATRIQAAIASNASLWLLWQSLTAQRDPMLVAGARFQQGWQALVAVLGADRAAKIAAALTILP